jgi:AcrR family transcriptional regulator
MPGDPVRARSAPAATGIVPDSSTPTIDRLLDTAAHLFWEKGFAATTTREIAEALHMRQASLYYHMASKEDLLYQICMSSLHQIRTGIPLAAMEAASPLERIPLLIRAHMGELLKFQKRNVTMLTELRSLAPRHRAEVVKLREKYTSFVRSTLEQAQAAGGVRTDIPAGYLCLALLNLLNWAALWFHRDEALSADQLSDLFIKIYLEGATAPRARRALALPDFKTQVTKSVARKIVKPPDHRTEDRLLDAAVALFSSKGYAATSTREVAALLGIQKASLYYHIESKEDLLYLICKSSLEQIHSDVESATKNVADPLARIQALISTHVESMLLDQDNHATTLAEMHALSQDRLAQVLALRHGYEDLVRSVMQGAQTAGALREDIDAKVLCLSALGLMNRVLVWYRPSGRLSPSQMGQLLAAIFLTGTAARPD